ncbi:hypothetical protein OC834_007904, partial [Tilletia horrida]
MLLVPAYQRLLVHRCADLFGLGHAINPETKAVTLTSSFPAGTACAFECSTASTESLPRTPLTELRRRPSITSGIKERHFESRPTLAALSNTDGSNPAASSSSTPRSV